jgi:predicted NBD/HSP70 family sugar kinase
MPNEGRAVRILVADVGGTHVKVLATGHRRPIQIPSGPTLTPAAMVRLVLEATRDWSYDVVSIGYPGPVVDGKPVRDPWNLGRGWVRFDFGRAFRRPVKVVNDAAMQALGSYKGGRMLFLGFGTGLGSALIVDGVLAPMELGHLPYKKGRSFEEYVGTAGLKRFGRKKWQRHALEVIALLTAALQADNVVVGGGNAKLLQTLPDGVRLGSNAHAFIGGYRLWAPPVQNGRSRRRRESQILRFARQVGRNSRR